VLAGLPVREFRWYKGRRHYSGWYWSATVGRLVAHESRRELARIMLADSDPLVTAIAAQPFRLAGPDGHRTRRHVPDILLGYAAGGVTVVDVKAPGKRGDPEVRAVMGWTREVAGPRGWGFEEWYGADPGLLANVSFLAGYRRPSVIDGRLVPAVLAAAGDGAPIAAVEERADAPAVLVRPAEVPLVGRIAAGTPVIADQLAELAEDVISLPRMLTGKGSLIALRVAGDSMTGAAIADGDWVVVRQQPDAALGDIVAATQGQAGNSRSPSPRDGYSSRCWTAGKCSNATRTWKGGRPGRPARCSAPAPGPGSCCSSAPPS